MVTTRRPSARPEHAPSLTYLIKQVELAAKAHLDELVAPHGITSLQYTALSVLARNPGMTGTRLARNGFVRLQSMAQTIRQLEEHGWIVREIDPESRRQRRNSLTPAGWAIIHAVEGPLEAFERDMLDGLTEEEVTVLGKSLQHIRHRLSGSHAR